MVSHSDAYRRRYRPAYRVCLAPEADEERRLFRDLLHR